MYDVTDDDVVEIILKKVLSDFEKGVFFIKDCYKIVVIQAIKKQIPLKPVEKLGETLCPTCEYILYSSDFDDWYNYRYKTLHCRDCGQALDWNV